MQNQSAGFQPITSLISQYKTQLLLILSAASLLYIILSLISLDVIFAIFVFMGSLGGFLFFKVKGARNGRIINKVSENARKLLTQKSIFDVYRDLVYYPKITKIIGAFVKGAVAKPPPEKLIEYFDELPQNVVKAINTKGVLHLAPEKVQKLFLDKPVENIQEDHFRLPDGYGKVNYQWYNEQKYNEEEVRIHEHTLGKQIAHGLNEKVKWKHIIGLSMLVVYGLMKTKGKKMSKIFIYNGSALGVMMLILLLLVKTSKPLKKYKMKDS